MMDVASPKTLELDFSVLGADCKTCVSGVRHVEREELEAYILKHRDHDLWLFTEITTPGQFCGLNWEIKFQ